MIRKSKIIINLLFFGLIFSALIAFAEDSVNLKKALPPQSSKLAKYQSATMVILYTGQSHDEAEEYENLQDVAQFAVEQFEEENNVKSGIKFVTVDDKDNPQHAQATLSKVISSDKPVAIVGPLYSNVAMGLKELVNKSEIPMISIFATHNDLTKNSRFIFRICASNRRLVKSMAEFLIPEAQKHSLNITSFKDLSDDYSIDLADTFRINVTGVKLNYNEVLFRGLHGIERLKDLNSQVWNPTKKDILFVPTRDLIAGRILAAMEGEPYMVAAIDTVNFLHLMRKIKPEKTHIRLVTTSQWIPQKSAFSKKMEVTFQKKFKRNMTITSALTFDAAYSAAAAYQRSQDKKISLADALRDSTKVTGVTGLILIGSDGERVFSDQFLKEEVIE